MSDEITRMRSPTRLAYTVWAGQVTEVFLRALQQRRIVGRRCPQCEAVFVPPRGSCPTCAAPPGEEVEVAQVGTITAFSVIRIPFEGQVLDPPYACAHVQLDGADTPLLHIIGECPVDDVQIGLRVQAVWADVIEPTLASIRYFKPVESA